MIERVGDDQHGLLAFGDRPSTCIQPNDIPIYPTSMRSHHHSRAWRSRPLVIAITILTTFLVYTWLVVLATIEFMKEHRLHGTRFLECEIILAIKNVTLFSYYMQANGHTISDYQ